MKILICTLGNRDIQFTEKCEGLEWKSNSKEGNYVLEDKKFLGESKKVLDNYEKYEKYILAPIIEKAVNEIENLEKIILIATNQIGLEKPHEKDTIYEAEVLKKFFERKYKISVEIFPVTCDIYDFSSLKDLFLELLFSHQEDELYFELSGGVPQFRQVFYIYIFMFENIKEIFEINENLGRVEKIKNKIIEGYNLLRIEHSFHKLLESYNYQGLLELFDFENLSNNRKIKLLKNLIILGINKKNFALDGDLLKKIYKGDIDYIKKILLNKKIISRFLFEKTPTEKMYASYIKELVDLIEIETNMKNFQTLAALIFRFMDSVGILLLYDYLSKNREKFSKNDVDFEELLKDEKIEKNSVIFHIILESSEFKEAEEIYSKEMKPKYDQNKLEVSLNYLFFYCFFKALKDEKYNSYLLLLELAKDKGSNERNLRALRNKGIYAHSFKYVTEEDFKKITNKTPEEFLNSIKGIYSEYVKEFLENEYSDENSYNLLNQFIKEQYFNIRKEILLKKQK
ncbi:MAG: hypothetical protein QXS41_03990 [Candidatus Woesearchaeota archaeon]